MNYHGNQEGEGSAKRGRGLKFGSEELNTFYKAYVEVLQDGGVGADQDIQKLWERVWSRLIYTYGRNTMKHTWFGLNSKFNAIKKDMNKFIECLLQVEREQQSGANEIDELPAAVKLFEARNKNEFKYLTCYPILKTMPKFNINICRNNRASQHVPLELDNQDDSFDLSHNKGNPSSGTEDNQGPYSFDRSVRRDKTKISVHKRSKMNDLTVSSVDLVAHSDDFLAFMVANVEKKAAAQHG